MKEGLICELTNKIANFNNNCSDFELDEKELLKLKARFNRDIHDNYATTTLEKLLSDENDFIKPRPLRNRFYSSAESTHGLEFKKGAYDKLFLFLLGLLISIFLYANLTSGDIWDLKSPNMIIMLALFLISIYFIYKVWFYDYETVIKIDRNGINIEEKILYWNDILDYGIIKRGDGNTQEEGVIIGTISSGIQKIDLSDLNISPTRLIEIIQLNKKSLPIHYKNH